MLQKSNMPPRSRRVLMFRQYCLSERLHDSQWIHSQISNTQMLINILSAHSKRMQNTLQECKWERERDRDGQTDSKWFMVRRAAPGECVSSFPALLHSVRCQTYPIHPERQTQRFTHHIWVRVNETLQKLSQIWSLTSSFALFLLGDFCLDSPRDFPLDLSFSLSFSFSLPFRSFSPSDSGEACKTTCVWYSSLSYKSCLKLYTLMNVRANV